MARSRCPPAGRGQTAGDRRRLQERCGHAPTFPRPAPASAPGVAATAPDPTQNGLLAGLDWLDSLSLTGLDGQNLNEIGLKNGNLVVDDQQRGNLDL